MGQEFTKRLAAVRWIAESVTGEKLWCSY